MPRPSYQTFLASLLPFVLTSALRADVVINEILYDSEPNTACDEFIELHNSGAEEVDLSGWYFSDGIEFVMPAGTALAPGGFLVIAQDPSSFTTIYGIAALGLGRWAQQ